MISSSVMGIASPASWLGFGAIGVLVRGALAFRANRRAAAAVQAHRHLAMLRHVARLTELDLAGVAPLLGAAPAEVHRWEIRGVPRPRQSGVRALFNAAVAFRRALPAAVTRRLLELGARGAAALPEEGERRRRPDSWPWAPPRHTPLSPR
jgi:hypothetical protein